MGNGQVDEDRPWKESRGRVKAWSDGWEVDKKCILRKKHRGDVKSHKTQEGVERWALFI